MTSSRYQRMVAIPEQEYFQSRNMQQVTHPLESEMSSLMSDYNKQDTIQDPYRKVHLQAETLDQMIKLKDELRQNMKSITPRAYLSRAEGLMNFVFDKLQFNERGELTDIKGDAIKNTNIFDLIQHAVRDRRRNLTPNGWQYFLNKLQDINAPRMLLNYETLDEMTSGSNPNAKKKMQDIMFDTAKTKIFKSPTLKRKKRLKAESLSDDNDASFSASESNTSPVLPIATRKKKRVSKRPTKYL